MPLVSIIIPTHNSEKHLKECLASVLNQTYKNIEIIIIDDASNDQTRNIIKETEKTNNKVKGYYFNYHIGTSIARNRGIDLAQGEYIFFLDSDDYLKETAIETLVSLANEYNVPLVKGNFKKTYNHQKSPLSKENIKINYRNLEVEKDFIKNHAGYVWNHLFNHDLIEEFRFPNHLYYEDIAFAYPILTKAKRCVTTSEILYYYRRHINSITIQNMLKPNEHILDIYEILIYIKRNCIRLGTYTQYQEQIDEIVKFISIYPMYTINTWITMKKEDKRKIIKILYQYAAHKYDYENILEIPLVKNKCQNNTIYRIRVKQIANILADITNMPSKDTIEEALKLIKKNIR